jgi:hypothetical protein
MMPWMRETSPSGNRNSRIRSVMCNETLANLVRKDETCVSGLFSDLPYEGGPSLKLPRRPPLNMLLFSFMLLSLDRFFLHIKRLWQFCLYERPLRGQARRLFHSKGYLKGGARQTEIFSSVWGPN